MRAFGLVIAVLLMLNTAAVQAKESNVAEKKKPSVEQAMLDHFLTYCLPPILTRTDTVRHAERNNLPQLPPDQAKVFTENGGKAYVVPDYQDHLVIITQGKDVCHVAGRNFSQKKLLKLVDAWFLKTKNTAFRLGVDEEKEGVLTRSYLADIKGWVQVLVRVAPDASGPDVQGTITAARVEPEKK